MPKIVHLTSVHRPEDIRIFTKQCRTLSHAGYQVVLVAAAPHDETRQGIRIRAVPQPKGRWQRMTQTVRHVYRAALDEDGDVYHFHDPELIPAGVGLKAHGKRVVYDVHEDVPKQKRENYWIPWGTRRTVGYLAGVIELSSARIFDGIVTATPEIAKRFPVGKTVTVRNYPIADELLLSEVTDMRHREPIALYVGNLAIGRGVTQMVEAASMIPKELQPQLVLAGDFPTTEFRANVEQLPGWRCVRYEGWCSRQHVRKLSGEARVGLVTLLPTDSYLESLPTKLLEYMSAGLPVIASNFPRWRRFVDGARCGLMVNPLRPREIADAWRWIIEHPDEAQAMGRRGQDAVRQHYNWENESQVLLDFYDRLVGPPHVRSRIGQAA